MLLDKVILTAQPLNKGIAPGLSKGCLSHLWHSIINYSMFEDMKLSLSPSIHFQSTSDSKMITDHLKLLIIV
jgi:hypothetical protein